MNRVRLTPMAVRDLASIRAYIEKELKNPAAAGRVVRQIMDEIRILRRYAQSGPSVSAKTGYPTDLRMLVCGNYLAFYRVEEKTVSIARVLYSGQDYLQILFGAEEKHTSN